MSERASRHVVVVGGGLAGLSAAIACLDGGAQVSLFESRPRLGGATWSFERNGLSFDNGQHVYLRCCSAYRRFLERIGTADLAPLQERLEVPVLRKVGENVTVSSIHSSNLPAPLHLLPGLLTYRHLSLLERIRLGRAARALMAIRGPDASLDDETFADFLRRHGQSERSISRLWDLICLPTMNVHAEEASLLLATKVFQTGLFSDAHAGDLGWATVPLSRLHAAPAEELLVKGGAHVARRAKVGSVEVSDQSGVRLARSVVVDGERVEADAVVLAVPHDALSDLVTAECIDDLTALSGLGHSPIIDVHLVYDRKVSDYPVAAGLDSPIQFVFDRTEAAGLSPADGQCLAISVSGADAEHGERPEVLIDRFQQAVIDLFPRARGATVRDAVVSREHRATFRAAPGSARLRRRPGTKAANLFLAGAWTDTGWPATMEGAVRSGVLAASEALAFIDAGRDSRANVKEAVA